MKAKIGDTYEYLTIVDDGTFKDIENKSRHVYFCLCKCGNDVRVPDSRWGITESCGCKRQETQRRIASERKERERKSEEARQATMKLIDNYLCGYKPDAQAR